MKDMKIERYAEYKDSDVDWIGEVPNTWDVVKLKWVFQEKKKSTNVDLPCGSISFGKVVYKDDEKIPASTKKSYQALSKGDYLLNPLNLNYDLKSLRIALSDKDVVVSSGYIILQSITEIDKSYFKWLLHIYDIAFMKTLGSGVRQTISFAHIKDSELVFPPLKEQTAIAEFLDRKTVLIDEAIDIKQKQIERLKERRQIFIHQAVTRGLNPDVEMKDSGVEWIGKVPGHWEVKALRFIGNTQNGLSKGGEYFGTGFPFLTYGDVYKDIELPKNLSGLAESSIQDQQQFSVQEGDVFFTRTSETVEEIAYSSTCMNTVDNATFAGFLIRFRPDQKTLFKGFSKFYFSSKTHRAFFIGEMNLVIRASLSQELLKRMPILIPPITEQNEIADYLEDISSKITKAISLKEQEIKKLKEYKSTLINSGVTGKIKVC